jgi:hypothetical protein
MKAYVPVRGMVKLESFIDTEGVYYLAAEVDAEDKRLQEALGAIKSDAELASSADSHHEFGLWLRHFQRAVDNALAGGAE